MDSKTLGQNFYFAIVNQKNAANPESKLISSSTSPQSRQVIEFLENFWDTVLIFCFPDFGLKKEAAIIHND